MSISTTKPIASVTYNGTEIALKSAEKEVWVLNEVPSGIPGNFYTSFSSNGQVYTILASGEANISYTQPESDEIIVYEEENGGWTNPAYRKLIFDTSPTGDLLTWLQANGVKQTANLAVQPSKSVSITSNGTTTITPDDPYDGVASVSVTTKLPNYKGYAYDNPSQVSGSGSYVTIVEGDETLKQVRSLDSLVVIYVAQGTASCTKAAGLWNTEAAALIYSTGTLGITKRLAPDGGHSNGTQIHRADDDTDVDVGSGRIYITPDGDLRIYGNTNAYPILAGEIVVHVMW